MISAFDSQMVKKYPLCVYVCRENRIEMYELVNLDKVDMKDRVFFVLFFYYFLQIFYKF